MFSLSKNRVFAMVAFSSASLMVAGLAWGLTQYYKAQALTEISVLQNDRGGLEITSKMPAFQVIRVFSATETSPTHYLMESMTTQKTYTDLDGMDGSLSWKIRGGNKFQNVLWSLSEKATSITYSDDLQMVVTRLTGCCGAVDTLRAYDLTSGKMILSYNDLEMTDYENVHQSWSRPFTLEIPNSPMALRLIGLITQDSTRDADFEPATAGYTAVALLKYNSRDGGYQKLQIETQMAENYGASVQAKLIAYGEGTGRAEIREGRATLWHRDGANSKTLVDGVAIQLLINNGTADLQATVPVVQDTLHLPSASIPAGLIIRKLR